MSHGYTRFRNMRPSRPPLPAVKRDVTFRKDDPQEPEAMNPIQKALAVTVARKRGELTDAQVADQHQTIAMELFPDSKNTGVALAKFYETEIGKMALGYAAQTAYADLQESARIGDGDIAVAKLDKDHAGSVAGVRPKVRHHQPEKKKRPATSHDGYSGHDSADPNRQQNDVNSQNVMARMAKYCDSMAQEYSARHGVGKSEAYDTLLKTDPAFGIVWKAALTVHAPQVE